LEGLCLLLDQVCALIYMPWGQRGVAATPEQNDLFLSLQHVIVSTNLVPNLIACLQILCAKSVDHKLKASAEKSLPASALRMPTQLLSRLVLGNASFAVAVVEAGGL